MIPTCAKQRRSPERATRLHGVVVLIVYLKSRTIEVPDELTCMYWTHVSKDECAISSGWELVGAGAAPNSD